LQPATLHDGNQRILAAAWLGDVRLIDNREI
jgi:pantothenate synthetase